MSINEEATAPLRTHRSRAPVRHVTDGRRTQIGSRLVLKELVQRGYPFVVMTNVLGGFALSGRNPFSTHGWNRMYRPTGLMDHNVRAISWPNTDTLYLIATLDLRAEPQVVRYPAFDSVYVSLETSALNHYIDIPLSSSRGDFQKPTTVLYYSANTSGYAGEPVTGVDRVHRLSGDLGVAFARIMPHSAEPERMARIMGQIQHATIQPLSAYLRGQVAPQRRPAVSYPPFGDEKNLFANHFLEVVQFAFNHTEFDQSDQMDRAAVAAFEKVGVVPGRVYDPRRAPEIDPAMLAELHDEVRAWARSNRQKHLCDMFLPRGRLTLEAWLASVATAPLGQPASEAVYPLVETADGCPPNARHDYVIRMSRDNMPPVNAFWSLTLYDGVSGFFIPNDRKKYTVGLNGGMKLNSEGGITIHIAAQKPESAPLENWLPIDRRDLDLSVALRLYHPDLERFKSWTPPKLLRRG
ncbi:MAG: DUF1214 domain-containing protein [Gemmatimonas sp.]|nr:DUF1214 domain-containing protein [Gemmatimonas sp.]